jgi:uncharacterized membrane protein
MVDILFSLSMFALAAVVIVLFIGLYSLFKGGNFRTNWSNRLMRLRILLQAIAIVLLCLLAWWKTQS